MSSVAASAQSERIATGRLVWAGLLTAATAAVANVVVFTVEKAALGVQFIMPLTGPGSPAAPLPAPAVVIASAVPAVGATILLAVLGRLVSRPIRVFRIIAAVFLLFSFGAPLSLPVDPATQLALMSMHIVAALIIVGILTTRAVEK